MEFGQDEYEQAILAAAAGDAINVNEIARIAISGHQGFPGDLRPQTGQRVRRAGRARAAARVSPCGVRPIPHRPPVTEVLTFNLLWRSLMKLPCPRGRAPPPSPLPAFPVPIASGGFRSRVVRWAGQLPDVLVDMALVFAV